MEPAFLLTFFAMDCLVFSFIKGAPLVQSATQTIAKGSRTHHHENPKFTNYIKKLSNRWQVKGIMNKQEDSQPVQLDIHVNDAQHKGIVTKERFVRHAVRCLPAWNWCYKKSKRNQKEERNQRTENEGSSTQSND